MVKNEILNCIQIRKHAAVRNKTVQTETVKFLLEQDLKATDKNSLGQTALHVACMSDQPAIVIRLLLDSIKKEFNHLMEKTTTNMTESSMGSFDSWLNSVTLLDLRKESPLHYASRSNNRMCCELLVAFGIDVRAKNANELFAHDLSTNSMVSMVLREEVRVHEDRAELVLHTQSLLEACKSGDLDVVKVRVDFFFYLVSITFLRNRGYRIVRG